MEKKKSGIIMEYIPYIIVIVIAVVITLLFFKTKKINFIEIYRIQIKFLIMRIMIFGQNITVRIVCVTHIGIFVGHIQKITIIRI